MNCLIEEILSNGVKDKDLMKNTHISELVKKLHVSLDKTEIPTIMSTNKNIVELVRENRTH